ncbi:LytS/YhcK type 5TM receptor domain-containing protein [Caenibacillus caldisaponilyticus]|uniref:LytS/YhcK type 5TM receptor domain-containing protein n=1 Tax=Caenibacillus caldisaponilyticus TaxID=1674942 RepID=UPI0009888566|nr:LytS/YhcK type 5TM receptor domain-containing protein [Caenibacillus caldisaponilyticus]
MEKLTLILFERIGLLLLLALAITRIPAFKNVVERDIKGKKFFYHSAFFGGFGIAATQAGVILSNGEIQTHLWTSSVPDGAMLVSANLVATAIAGLFGGPKVGVGSGLIVMVYTFSLGGDGALANAVVHPIAGLIVGSTARFFSKERVIAPEKALFIGMFTPILNMCLLLMFTRRPEHTIQLVNTIGIPSVIVDSIAIAVFTAVIHLVLREKEQEAAWATARALKIVDAALPFLKQAFHPKSAASLAELLLKELDVAAVALTDRHEVLAHVGDGSDHHMPGQPIQAVLSKKAIESGEMQVAYQREDIRCRDARCPLQAAIIVPLLQSAEVRGLIKIYFKRAQHIRKVELALAKGLGRLLSNQLDVLAVEKMKHLIHEAELRNLQAQINPHFLFNTLHSIDTLVRIDPDKARHLIVQLSTFMRFNLKLTALPLIPLKKEIEHVKAYAEIVQARFPDRLDIQIRVPEKVDEAVIPPFTIQPLVENSLVHGLKNVENGGRIDVDIAEQANGFLVNVTDNGQGLPREHLDRLGKEPLAGENGNGTGLYNVNQRLITVLGEGARLSFTNLEAGGCRVSFRLPKAVKKGEEENEIQGVNRGRRTARP